MKKEVHPEIEFLEGRAERLAHVAIVDFVEPSLNLLAHAQSIELEVGSRCGGHGVCGGDRIRLHAPVPAMSEITDAERRHLTEAELAKGYRLACQCFPNDPNTSIKIEIGA